MKILTQSKTKIVAYYKVITMYKHEDIILIAAETNLEDRGMYSTSGRIDLGAYANADRARQVLIELTDAIAAGKQLYVMPEA